MSAVLFVGAAMSFQTGSFSVCGGALAPYYGQGATGQASWFAACPGPSVDLGEAMTAEGALSLSDLSAALQPYVTADQLSTALGGYVTQAQLAATVPPAFDATVAAEFWSGAFCSVIFLWWVGRNIGLVMGVLHR